MDLILLMYCNFLSYLKTKFFNKNTSPVLEYLKLTNNYDEFLEELCRSPRVTPMFPMFTYGTIDSFLVWVDTSKGYEHYHNLELRCTAIFGTWYDINSCILYAIYKERKGGVTKYIRRPK